MTTHLKHNLPNTPEIRELLQLMIDLAQEAIKYPTTPTINLQTAKKMMVFEATGIKQALALMYINCTFNDHYNELFALINGRPFTLTDQIEAITLYLKEMSDD